MVDPENPYILQNHLRTAALELPLADADGELFGALTLPIAEALRDAEQLNEIGGRFYATSSQSPSNEFSLRHMSNNTFAIIERVEGPEVRDQKSEVRNQKSAGHTPLTTHHSLLLATG